MSNRRREILDKASEMFSRWSYHKVSLEDISSSLGIGKSTMYHYFRTKEELFTEVIQENMEKLLNHVYYSLDDTKPFATQLKNLVYLTLQFFSENRDVILLLVREKLDFVNISTMKDEFEGKWKTYYDEFYNRFSSNLEKAKANGEVLPVDTTLLLANIFGTIIAVSLDYTLNHPEKDLKDIQEDCYRVILKGIVV